MVCTQQHLEIRCDAYVGCVCVVHMLGGGEVGGKKGNLSLGEPPPSFLLGAQMQTISLQMTVRLSTLLKTLEPRTPHLLPTRRTFINVINAAHTFWHRTWAMQASLEHLGWGWGLVAVGCQQMKDHPLEVLQGGEK